MSTLYSSFCAILGSPSWFLDEKKRREHSVSQVRGYEESQYYYIKSVLVMYQFIVMSFVPFQDLTHVMNRIALFLGKKLSSDQLSILSEHLSFTSMKANPAVNFQHRIKQLQEITGSKEKGEFMRNGNVDQWKTAGHVSGEH